MTQPLTLAMVYLAVHIADEETVALIEDEAHADPRLQGAGAPWRDVRPMISAHEHSSEVIDLHSARLAYATARGLIQVHPTLTHLVRIVRPPRGALGGLSQHQPLQPDRPQHPHA